jgi:hypothetical protein
MGPVQYDGCFNKINTEILINSFGPIFNFLRILQVCRSEKRLNDFPKKNLNGPDLGRSGPVRWVPDPFARSAREGRSQSACQAGLDRQRGGRPKGYGAMLAV